MRAVLVSRMTRSVFAALEMIELPPTKLRSGPIGISGVMRKRRVRGGWLHRRYLRELHRGRVRRKRAEMTGNGNGVSL